MKALENVRQLVSGMPVPVSATDSSTPPGEGVSDTLIEPDSVYLKAFDSRLSTIFSHMS